MFCCNFGAVKDGAQLWNTYTCNDTGCTDRTGADTYLDAVGTVGDEIFSSLCSGDITYKNIDFREILLNSLECVDPSELKMGVILKAYDDCRQDTLALQVMHLLEVIWESEGIDIPLMVYNVTPARTSDKNKAMGGIIECVGGWGVM